MRKNVYTRKEKKNRFPSQKPSVLGNADGRSLFFSFHSLQNYRFGMEEFVTFLLFFGQNPHYLFFYPPFAFSMP